MLLAVEVNRAAYHFPRVAIDVNEPHIQCIQRYVATFVTFVLVSQNILYDLLMITDVWITSTL